MTTRRDSSRGKFADYKRQRPWDQSWEKKATDEKSKREQKSKRGRGFFELYRRFWAFTSGHLDQQAPAGPFTGHRSYVYLALLTLSATTLIGLVIPASTKVAIDYVLTNNPGPEGIPPQVKRWLGEPLDAIGVLWWLGGAVVALSTLSVLIGTIGRWQMTRVTKRLQAHIRRMAFEHAVKLPLHRIHHYKSGGMASLLRDDAGLAGELLFSMVYNPWRAIVQLVGTLIVLAWVDWRMLVGAIMLVPVVWVTHKTWIGRIRPLYRDAKVVRQGVDATTTEAFGGMRVVRGFARERAESSRFTVGQHYMTRIEVLTWWWSRVLEVAWSVMIPVASAGVLIYGGSRVVKGQLTIGDVMMFSTYLLMLLGPLETLTNTASAIQSNLAALDRVLDLLEEGEEFGGNRGGLVVNAQTSRGDMELRDVWFSYPRPPKRFEKKPVPDGTQPLAPADAPPQEPPAVIQGVSFKVRAGETIALVGPSGSGKTTLCNLIARFYDPASGSISFDGVDLREIDVNSFRSLLGIVEQDVFLFDGTIADNIAYARRDASEADIIAGARSANAHEFILALDKGYDTMIGERGVRLSGGQKQRIAIARAIVANPRILILDEATSNLDSESEALIQQSLAGLMIGRTSFVIAHRLSTVRHATKIVVMEHGRVTEMGTHDELSARGGRYADLLRLQLGGHSLTPPALRNGVEQHGAA